MLRTISFIFTLFVFQPNIYAQANEMTAAPQIELPKAMNACLARLDKHIKPEEKKKLIKYPAYGGELRLPTWISVHCVEHNLKLRKQFAVIGLTDIETISMFIYCVYSNRMRDVKFNINDLLKSSLKAQEIRLHGVPKDAKGDQPPVE